MQVRVDAFKVFVPRRLKNSIIVNMLSKRIPTARSLLLPFFTSKDLGFANKPSLLVMVYQAHGKAHPKEKNPKKKKTKRTKRSWIQGTTSITQFVIMTSPRLVIATRELVL